MQRYYFFLIWPNIRRKKCHFSAKIVHFSLLFSFCYFDFAKFTPILPFFHPHPSAINQPTPTTYTPFQQPIFRYWKTLFLFYFPRHNATIFTSPSPYQLRTIYVGYTYDIAVKKQGTSNNSAIYQLQRSDLLTTPSRFHLSVSTFFVLGCQCAQRILPTQTKYNPRIDNNWQPICPELS